MATPPTQMATGGLERIYDALQSTVPGVNTATMQMEAWNTIEDFCRQSTLWRETVEWVLPVGSREVDFNPVSAVGLATWVLDVQGLTSFSVTPPAILVDGGDTSLARSGFARVVLKPARLNNSLPHFLVNEWFEAIVDGTKARLYGQPAKPYSAPALAEFHGKRNRSAIRQARDAANRYYRAGTSGWRFPQFAAGSGLRNRVGWP